MKKIMFALTLVACLFFSIACVSASESTGEQLCIDTLSKITEQLVGSDHFIMCGDVYGLGYKGDESYIYSFSYKSKDIFGEYSQSKFVEISRAGDSIILASESDEYFTGFEKTFVSREIFDLGDLEIIRYDGEKIAEGVGLKWIKE